MAKFVAIVGNFFDDETRVERSISSDSPAASRKMLMMAEALVTVEHKAVLLSYGRGLSGFGRKYFDQKNSAINGIHITYLPFIAGGTVSKFYSAFLMALKVFWMGLVHRPVFVFYNRYYGHLPSIIIAKLTGAKVFLDLEDESPRKNLTSKFYSSFFDYFCNGVILACSAMENGLSINHKYIYYGVAPLVSSATKFIDSKINILVSGTFDANTGSLVLYEAINKIKSNPNLIDKFHFHLIGYGEDYERLLSLSSDGFVSAYGRVDQTAYTQIINLCDVGLSLKLPSGLYASTTFPSKVIEYVSHGLLLISYDISDVKAVLGNSVVYLEYESPICLIDNLMLIASNRTLYAQMATRGQLDIVTNMNLAKSGEALSAFLKGSSCS